MNWRSSYAWKKKRREIKRIYNGKMCIMWFYIKCGSTSYYSVGGTTSIKA